MNHIPKPEHPRPDWHRKDWYNLNGAWGFEFGTDDQDAMRAWSTKAPEAFSHCIQVPFSWASPLSGIGQNKKGAAWYARCVDWQPESTQGRIFLNFGAVDYTCKIWVNGKEVGSHTGGYGPFEVDVTFAWNRDEQNLITVWVEDKDETYQARGKQGYGEIRGIWQTPWLESRPLQYLDSIQFTSKTDGLVRVACVVMAEDSGIGQIRLQFGPDIDEVRPVHLSAGENQVEVSFCIKAPKLWSPDMPFLYEGEVSLEKEGVTDTVFTYFGIREIGTLYREDKGFRWITLNGKPIYLSGTLDQAFHPQGFFTYPSDQDMKDEIWRLKRLGLNFVRIHIKPEEPRKLYWADKLGILVMEDMPCFWGEPEETARRNYEQEAKEILQRDFNHPSIFSWVMFNETWGLFTNKDEGNKGYLPETHTWVKDIYAWAKAQDATRLIEDNSPCNYDHLMTDINTWHFYVNGYEPVRDHIEHVVTNTIPGSPFNYVAGYLQGDAPLMNSECGNVWGIEGSAGDSDIAWHYRYMLNEFRRHDKICGFVFTEFHDVVNEFNGYYRMDNSDKDFGYDWFCEGMTLKDLHSSDFIVVDAPPCQTVSLGTKVVVPLLISSFTDQHHHQKLTLEWSLWFDGLGTRKVHDCGSYPVMLTDYGTTSLPAHTVTMPHFDALAVLSLYLKNENGQTISRNFTTFDVQSDGECVYPLEGNFVSIPPTIIESGSWNYQWTAIGDEKMNGGGSGYFEYCVELPQINDNFDIGLMEIYFEASAKRVYEKDMQEESGEKQLMNFMHGDRENPGTNSNSYFMTDEEKFPSKVMVHVNDTLVETLMLPDDPADSRGVLSWHSQSDHRHLDEAGSYGYLQRIVVPGALLPDILRRGSLTLRLKVETADESSGGLALYGRNAGRYPIGIVIRYL